MAKLSPALPQGTLAQPAGDVQVRGEEKEIAESELTTLAARS